MTLKTKLGLGIGFLFLVILVFGILSIYSIEQLKSDSRSILKNNYETLVYSNNMLQALDKLETDSSYANYFEKNLKRQEANITEPGEREATAEIKTNFERIKSKMYSDSQFVNIRTNLQVLNDLNQQAIFNKNQSAEYRAETASTWLVITFTILTLIAFTLAVNFPSVISGPIKALSDGIAAIVNKDYSKRIHLNQKDEFGDLANAFNVMAEKLDEYEHSTLAQLKFEKSRMETIINQMTDGIILLDDKKSILLLNSIAEKLLELKSSDIIGKYAPDVALTNDLMRNLLQENSNKKDLKIYADGKESYFDLVVLNVNNNDQVIGQVIVLRNITPFHELNEAKTNFIATVSHELKTPISSIKMSTQLLSDSRVGAVNPEQQELVKSINDDANRLLKITSELLNMSQVETGQIQLKIQPASVVEIIEPAVSSVELLFDQKNIRLLQSIEEKIPLVQADTEKTSWVLINLLTNAIKYSSDGSSIELIVKAENGKVRFNVKDQGKGIEKRYLSRIFDRYYKIPGSLGSGTGLGLTISREFIEAQGGLVWVDSELGAGSIFGFSIPFA